MVKKSVAPLPGAAYPPEWDPALKEPWHLTFENEPVNDDKWSCIVTAAIPAEAGDDEFIQTYTQCVKTGLRKFIKVISMSDVVKLLKGSTSVMDIETTKRDKLKLEKSDKMENPDRGTFKLPTPRFNKIVELAAIYATFTDSECKLPPDLMAAVIKYLILNLKDENCLQRRVEAVKKRKMREKKLKKKFIRNLKPFEVSEEEKRSFGKVSPNFLGLDEPINDHPFNGPDLYIMLTDMYDLFAFPELIRIGVPFLAILKVSYLQNKGKSSLTFVPSRVVTNNKRASVLLEFWEKLKENCISLEETKQFKDIMMMGYEVVSPAFLKSMESKQESARSLFDELTWMQYSTFTIYRQHQMYLREQLVQPVVLSLQYLDLATCEVYNKMCDALVTGEPLTPALVLYAMIEQVVVGVPETESVIFEYEYKSSNFVPSECHFISDTNESVKPRKKTVEYTIPCYICRDKVRKNICDKLKNALISEQVFSVKNDPSQISEETSAVPSQNEEFLVETSRKCFTKVLPSKESAISENLGRIIAEKKSEKVKKDKKWKAPTLCFHGDQVLLQLYHVDPRILTPETLINRFFKKSNISQIWKNYPELHPAHRAFFNFHFASLQKISQETEESLKLIIHFTISMKLIGMMKSYLYRGDEENLSEKLFSSEKDKLKKFSKVKFQQNTQNLRRDDKNFSNYFFKPFIASANFKKKCFPMVDQDQLKSLETVVDSESIRKAVGNFSLSFVLHRSSGIFFSLPFRSYDSTTSSSFLSSDHTRTLSNLFHALDHPEISSLIEPHFLNDKDDYLQLIQGFTFYEKLEPSVMIQRLLEAQENFNTLQCFYFKPTDTLVMVVMNDFDYRGIFYTFGCGVLTTPVSLRDFYNYVYQDILQWLTEEDRIYMKFISDLEEQAKAEEDKKDEEYLRELKREYCVMSQDERQNFLETPVDTNTEPEVTEEELKDLPIKPKYCPPRKISFITTNLVDVRVEANQKVNEFYSRDGTEVNVSIDSWLYDCSNLLTLIVKRPKLQLYYYLWLECEDPNTSFTLKTNSDIIFSFYKNDAAEEENYNYNVNISWPTGLLIQPVPSNSGMYVRQSYLKVYKSGWDIEEEKSRCFLQNGQVIIFKENGDYNILSGNGTKYLFYETAAVPRYEIITPTGEVWEVKTQGPCRYRKKLRTTLKIFIGVDPKTQETFYRREDGVNCMLWPNGRLVTSYSDGTKITSTPYFDQEVTTEWTEEEKLYFVQMESKYRLEREFSELRSKTILRNSSAPRMSESVTFVNEPFICISHSYLIEHPKYATAFFNPEEPCITLTMPHEVKISIYPEGNYVVRKDRNVFTVKDTAVEFCLTCKNCNDKSVATLNLNDNEILCKFVDFFQKAFLVHRNGKTTYQDVFQESDEEEVPIGALNSTPSTSLLQKCIGKHTKNHGENQRCFAFERDLSGVEFIHADSFALDCYKLPEDTYFDLESGQHPNFSHTFSSPYYKVGYETWVMEYEDKDDCLPTNLKKKDLKELGIKENPGNPFRYPFPKYHNSSEQTMSPRTEMQLEMPKVTIARIIKCLSAQPNTVIQTLQNYIAVYQKKARNVFSKMADFKPSEEPSKGSRCIKTKLRNIALALNQSFNMYSYLRTQFPSTEKDIHYCGHFINLMEGLKNHKKEERDLVPDCKQIPKPLPRSSDFSTIFEENEF